MLMLTDEARDAIHVLTEDGPAECGVRIATHSHDGDGEAPEISLALAAAPEAGDEVIEGGGARVFVEPEAARMLGDQTLDVQVDPKAQQVSFFVR